MPAASRVQRETGGRAGGPQTAGSHADRIHQQPEGGAEREGEKARGTPSCQAAVFINHTRKESKQGFVK